MEITKNEFLNKQLKKDDVLIPMSHIKDVFTEENGSNYNLLIVDSLYDNDYIDSKDYQNGYELEVYKTPFNGKIKITKSLKSLRNIMEDLGIKNKFVLYRFLYAKYNISSIASSVIFLFICALVIYSIYFK